MAGICRALAATVAVAAGTGLWIGCTPRVQIEPPKEPIVIHLNVKIEQEVRVRVDRDLDELIAEDEDIFGTGAGEKP